MGPERFESLVRQKCVEKGHLPDAGRCLRCGDPVKAPARPEDATRETEPATPKAKRARRQKVSKELPGGHPAEVVAELPKPKGEAVGAMPYMQAHPVAPMVPGKPTCRVCSRPISSHFQFCTALTDGTCEPLVEGKVEQRIVGIDPGFASIGYCSLTLGARDTLRVEAFGVFNTKKANAKARALAIEDNVRRTGEIAKWMRGLISKPGTIAICAEAMSFPRNASAAAKMAMTWGVIVTLADELQIPIFQATPQEVKISACNNRKASKEEIQAAMRAKFKQTIELQKAIRATAHEHCFDALAAADACAKGALLRVARRAR